jgi:protein-L-isoaspartate(D-aspartate) O-methyltransferase
MFVPAEYCSAAYADAPLPIGEGQTISQPYIVALMTASLHLRDGDRVLEIGTGSGYQTAVLAELGTDVWTIERSVRLSRDAEMRLRQLGYTSVHCLVGDGTLGAPRHAPFDRIIASGSLPKAPPWLREQLVDRGIFIGPIGSRVAQELTRIMYDGGAFGQEALADCRFVPLVGACGWTI